MSEAVKALAGEILKLQGPQQNQLQGTQSNRLEYLAALEAALTHYVKKNWPADQRSEVISAHVRNVWRLMELKKESAV